MRKKFLILFIFFILGLISFHSSHLYLLSAALPALFLIFFIKKQSFMTVFSVLFLLLGFLAAYVHYSGFEHRYSFLRKSSLFQGYVIESRKNSFTLKNYNANYKIIASSYKALNVKPGDYVVFKGEVGEKPLYKKNRMNSSGIDAYVTIKNYDIEKINKYDVRMIPIKIREKINSALIGIDKSGGGFISGLITGYTEDLEDNDKDNFDNLGISHILAISGFNLGIVYYFSTKLLKDFSARLRHVLVILLCFIYTLIGGFQPSIFRAFVMICIANAGKILNRPYDILHGITLSAFVMLIFNSYFIYNPGFILSFLATSGIILLKDDIRDSIPEKIQFIGDELSVALSAFISTFPMVIWYRGFVSVISIGVNILLNPLVAFITVLGFVASFIYILTGINLVLYPVVFLGVLFLRLIKYMMHLNFQWFIEQPKPVFIVVYYALILMVFGYFNIKRHRRVNYSLKVFLAVLCIILLFYHGKLLKIHILNVGQGDSIFIETPERKCILIDTGPEFKDYSALKEHVLPYVKRKGYSKIDLLLITHFHRDHAGGLDYLLKNYRVDSLAAYKKPEKSIREFIELSKGNSIKVGSVLINVLYPPKNMTFEDDKNETCLVMELLYKDFSMLLTADAEVKILEGITGDYDVFKVSHHGSADAFSKKLIDNLKMDTAVISVGKNSFGHPSKDVVDELKKNNIEVFRTDQSGDISIVTEGKGYKVLFE